jgi:hypothetical protein
MNANLDPRARAAANYLKDQKLFSEGPIIPWWLGPVLPPRSKRRGWRDYVALFILSDIISAHRLKEGKVFFRGALYQVNRERWAEQIPTTLKEISLTLTWLAEDLGVIGRDQRPRLIDGKPCGSQTFVWPIPDRLQELLDYYLEHNKAMPVENRESDTTTETGESRDGIERNSEPDFEATPSTSSKQSHSPVQGNPSLTSASPTAAKGCVGGGRSECQRANPAAHTDAPGSAAIKKPGAPPKLQAPNKISPAAPTLWSPPAPPKAIQLLTAEDKTAWEKAMRFSALWEEAIVRSNVTSCSAFTFADKSAAFAYFKKHPEIVGWFALAVAIHAWKLAVEDAQPDNSRQRVYHIPFSLDPRRFLGSMQSGKIEAEVGLFVRVNAWDTLRSFFTESELRFFGWSKVPVQAMEPDHLWEYCSLAPRYYRDRNRDLPPEVLAVVNHSDHAKQP